MTVKRMDYIRLADALRAAKPADDAHPAALQAWANTCKTVAEHMAVDSWAFDDKLFLENCGVRE